MDGARNEAKKKGDGTHSRSERGDCFLSAPVLSRSAGRAIHDSFSRESEEKKKEATARCTEAGERGCLKGEAMGMLLRMGDYCIPHKTHITSINYKARKPMSK
jgi:hypothetical protein